MFEATERANKVSPNMMHMRKSNADFQTMSCPGLPGRTRIIFFPYGRLPSRPAVTGRPTACGDWQEFVIELPTTANC